MIRKTPSSQGAIENHRKKGVRWERGKACSVPSDRPLKFVYKKREIVTRFSPFCWRREIIGSENHHPSFPAITILCTKAFACVSAHTVIVCREIIIRHFFSSASPLFFFRFSFIPIIIPPFLLSSLHSRACWMPACRSHFRTRSPGVERYRSVPDREANGFFSL